LGYSICYVNLSGDRLNDDSLNRLLNNTPGKSILLLEDIDAIFESREIVNKDHGGGRGYSKKGKVSFSGLLNALDGIRSQEGKILFMTTNHRERLDTALLRPGRSDVQVCLQNSSHKQMVNFFKVFFPNEEKKAELFAQKLPEWKVSIAKLQGHLVKYRESADVCLEKVREIVQEEEHLNDMPISEWFERLNLSKYIYRFH
jgi:chaperone BCS1